MKAATAQICTARKRHGISIHAAREGGDKKLSKEDAAARISIHAAREGGDMQARHTQTECCGISIHAAREGGDPLHVTVDIHADTFQSTPPVKAATAETYKCNQHFRKQQV